jgi:hypothetical protein
MKTHCLNCKKILPYPTLSCPQCEAWLWNPKEQESGLPASAREIEKCMRNKLTWEQWSELPDVVSCKTRWYSNTGSKDAIWHEPKKPT